MASTRRAFLALPAVALGGCLSDPGRSCSGATVRLSLRPGVVEPSIRFDADALSTEAIGVLETAIEDEHVERCVSWGLSPDGTGPSPGLTEIGERIESHVGVDLSGRAEPVSIDARYEGTDYRLTLAIERSA